MMHIATRWRVPALRNRIGAVPTMLCAVAALSFPSGGSPAAAPIAVAVADFDYFDTSEKSGPERGASRPRGVVCKIAARSSGGAGRLSRGADRMLRSSCTATSMSQDVFIAAARKAGARLVVYGGIRKMSTLVQWGEIQLLDLEAEKLLMRRTVTFRGDNDAAYRHAANFVGDQLKETMPKP